MAFNIKKRIWLNRRAKRSKENFVIFAGSSIGSLFHWPMSFFIRHIYIILSILLLSGLENVAESRKELSCDNILSVLEECVLKESQTPQQNLLDAYRDLHPQATSRCTLTLKEAQSLKNVSVLGSVFSLMGNQFGCTSYSIVKHNSNRLCSPVDYFVYGLHRIIV